MFNTEHWKQHILDTDQQSGHIKNKMRNETLTKSNAKFGLYYLY